MEGELWFTASDERLSTARDLARSSFIDCWAALAPSQQGYCLRANRGLHTRGNAAGYHYLKALTGLIGLSRHSETDVLTFLRHTRRCDESRTSLAEVAEKQPEAIVWTHDHWNSVEQELPQLQKGRTP